MLQSNQSESRTHVLRKSGWFVLGLLIVAGAFVYLESRQPYYFTQDDALVANLPGTIAGFRSIWNGIWPDYDGCRLMGGPLASTGMFMMTYPAAYLSYAIARHVLHNEFATLEVFAAIHMLAGYWLTYWLCRRRGIRAMIACCASVSFILSGSTLVMGRSWPPYVAVLVWLPLLMRLVDRLAEGDVGKGWIIGMGAVIGVLFHVGFPQLWVYAMLLIAFAIVWLKITGMIPWRRFFAAGCAGIIGIGLCVPLLVPELTAAHDVERPPVYGDGFTWHWIAALVPYPLVKVPHPMYWGSMDTQYMGHFVYFGTTFAVLFLMALVAMFFARPIRKSLGENTWIVCAVLALLLAMGKQGGLFFVLSQVPLVKMVNNDPFRALPFFVLFAVIGGAIFAERTLQRQAIGKCWPNPIPAITLVLMGYHVYMARPSFYTYGFRPYPPVPQAILKHFQGRDFGRMMAWSPQRSISRSLASVIPHNMPMLYNAPALSGYDPLLEYGTAHGEVNRLLDEKPAEAARAYGLRWHLVSPLLFKPVLSPNPFLNPLETTVKYAPVLHSLSHSLKWVNHFDDVRVGELTDVALMAFPAEKPDFYLPVTTDGHGITVQLARLHGSGDIVVNYLWYAQFRATVDGKRVAVTHDEWQRTVVRVPNGAKVLEIRYAAGWAKGLAIGTVLVLVGLTASVLTSRVIPPAR